MGCPSETQRSIYIGALLHDIGKIGMEDAILRKDGQLTPRVLDCIKKHPQLGCAIVKDIEPSDDVLSVVLHHHEQWDGSGYPLGLRGHQIPRAARICALADAFDAMSSDRPYRKGMPAEKVDDILRAGAGKQWDPEIVELYLGCRHAIRRAVFHYPTGHSVKTHSGDSSPLAMHGPSPRSLPEPGIGESLTVSY
jgi:HD-GYP domain-containing protein (c-di-GMP phosphodiesterase class II)